MSRQSHDEVLDGFFATLQVELLSKKNGDVALQFARDRLLSRMRKRASLGGSDLSDIAVEDFLTLNQAVKDNYVCLSPDVVESSRFFIRKVLEDYTTSEKDINIQNPLDLCLLFDHWRFGPGASFGTRSKHAAEKLYDKWSTTKDAQELIHRLRRNHPYLAFFDKLARDDMVPLSSGSKLATVPKNEETERTIAIEPLGNMNLQLAAGTYIQLALKRIGLNIQEQQPRNKDAARRGSIDGLLATIDLKSASDMIKPELVRLLFPSEWYNLFMAIRSHKIVTPDGQWHEMHMISTMGNGFTFPLMTLILLSLVVANRKSSRSAFVDWEKTFVFGDDIIIPDHEYHSLCVVLTWAGLVVNTDKSFSDGPFRESCGGDYYEGVDVTPFYTRTLRTDPEIYVAINQVLEWSARTKMFLYDSVQYLFRLLRGRIFLVPEWSNPDSGVKVAQVPRHYKFLQPIQERLKLVNDLFATPLVVGGFVCARGSDLFFLPRLITTRYRVRRMRLPKGFLNGYDPLTRSVSVSHDIDLIVNSTLLSLASSV